MSHKTFIQYSTLHKTQCDGSVPITLEDLKIIVGSGYEPWLFNRFFIYYWVASKTN